MESRRGYEEGEGLRERRGGGEERREWEDGFHQAREER